VEAGRLGTAFDRNGLELAWLAFAIANLAAMAVLITMGGPPDWETVPFHFIYVSFTILYGFRAWRTGRTILGITFVTTSTGLLTLLAIHSNRENWAELTEVPLMSLMFMAMVFHVRRRQQATAVAQRLAHERSVDLTRQKAFLSDVSHELMTPITIARGSIDVLGQGGARSPADVDDTLAIVSGELARMSRLIQRLLLLENAAVADRLRPVPTAVGPFLREAHARWARAGDHEITLGETPEGTAPLERDHALLALDAALENAVQHAGPDTRIELRGRADGGRLTLEVHDTGPGIDPAELPRLFERFYRPDSARNRRHGGAGLGLAIVDAIMQAHGGEAAIVSAPGEGTTVSLLFPGYVPGGTHDVAAVAHRGDLDHAAQLSP
jgi:signal transduction histidine kinase